MGQHRGDQCLIARLPKHRQCLFEELCRPLDVASYPPRDSQDEDGDRHTPKAASFPAEGETLFEQLCLPLELAPGSYHHPQQSLEFGGDAVTTPRPEVLHAFQPQAFLAGLLRQDQEVLGVKPRYILTLLALL